MELKAGEYVSYEGKIYKVEYVNSALVVLINNKHRHICSPGMVVKLENQEVGILLYD